MNNDFMNDEDGRLRELLHSWQLNSTLPPRFQEQVWRRISLAERREAPGLGGRWTAFLATFAGALRSPAGALGYLAALLVAGSAVGYLSSENYAQDTETAWRAAYVQSVTPVPAIRP